MDKIIIEGGVPLNGDVTISGAKNAALPALSASLLTGGWNTLCNIPSLKDIKTIKEILSNLGVLFEENGQTFRVNSDNLNSHNAPYKLVKTMRASILVLGPLLSRLGKAKISLPGGCAIGTGPIDLHLKGLSAMGADIVLEHGYVVATAKKLRGANIFFDIATVTGTENLMMAAVKAEQGIYTRIREHAAFLLRKTNIQVDRPLMFQFIAQGRDHAGTLDPLKVQIAVQGIGE